MEKDCYETIEYFLFRPPCYSVPRNSRTWWFINLTNQTAWLGASLKHSPILKFAAFFFQGLKNSSKWTRQFFLFICHVKNHGMHMKKKLSRKISETWEIRVQGQRKFLIIHFFWWAKIIRDSSNSLIWNQNRFFKKSEKKIVFQLFSEKQENLAKKWNFLCFFFGSKKRWFGTIKWTVPYFLFDILGKLKTKKPVDEIRLIVANFYVPVGTCFWNPSFFAKS